MYEESDQYEPTEGYESEQKEELYWLSLTKGEVLFVDDMLCLRMEIDFGQDTSLTAYRV